MNDLEPLASIDVIQHVNISERRASRCSIAHKSVSRAVMEIMDACWGHDHFTSSFLSPKISKTIMTF